jgi:hypothetical protein
MTKKHNNNSGNGFIISVVVLLVIVMMFIYIGLPAIRLYGTSTFTVNSTN